MPNNNKNITVGDILNLIENSLIPNNIWIDEGPDKENIAILSPLFAEDYNNCIITGILVCDNGALTLRIG